MADDEEQQRISLTEFVTRIVADANIEAVAVRRSYGNALYHQGTPLDYVDLASQYLTIRIWIYRECVIVEPQVDVPVWSWDIYPSVELAEHLAAGVAGHFRKKSFGNIFTLGKRDSRLPLRIVKPGQEWRFHRINRSVAYPVLMFGADYSIHRLEEFEDLEFATNGGKRTEYAGIFDSRGRPIYVRHERNVKPSFIVEIGETDEQALRNLLAQHVAIFASINAVDLDQNQPVDEIVKGILKTLTSE